MPYFTYGRTEVQRNTGACPCSHTSGLWIAWCCLRQFGAVGSYYRFSSILAYYHQLFQESGSVGKCRLNASWEAGFFDSLPTFGISQAPLVLPYLDPSTAPSPPSTCGHPPVVMLVLPSREADGRCGGVCAQLAGAGPQPASEAYNFLPASPTVSAAERGNHAGLASGRVPPPTAPSVCPPPRKSLCTTPFLPIFLLLSLELKLGFGVGAGEVRGL